MSNDSSTEKPEVPPQPGSARAARGGRISGRVFLVLSVSITLAVVAMIAAWFMW